MNEDLETGYGRVILHLAIHASMQNAKTGAMPTPHLLTFQKLTIMLSQNIYAKESRGEEGERRAQKVTTQWKT